MNFFPGNMDERGIGRRKREWGMVFIDVELKTSTPSTACTT
jgi:hypothetical protein